MLTNEDVDYKDLIDVISEVARVTPFDMNGVSYKLQSHLVRDIAMGADYKTSIKNFRKKYL